MAVKNLATYVQLRRRYNASASTNDADADERQRVIAYVQQYSGQTVQSASDLIAALADLSDEEELSAHACLEGVAVTHMSDGWWLLFRDDEPLLSPQDGAVGSEYDRC